MGKEKKKDKSVEKVLTMSRTKGISVHDFISKSMQKKLEKKYGKISFPMLGIVFENEDKFIFLFHESIDSIKEKKLMISNLTGSSEEELEEFIEFVKKK